MNFRLLGVSSRVTSRQSLNWAYTPLFSHDGALVEDKEGNPRTVTTEPVRLSSSVWHSWHSGKPLRRVRTDCQYLKLVEKV